MNKDTVGHDEHDVRMPRRDFLRKSLLLALPATFGGMATSALAATMSSPLPASLSTTAAFIPPTRARGSAVIDVRNYGAVGDGVHDDTTAFRTAISALPSTGGTIHVPAGVYLIDPVRRVTLRSRMHLRLADGAVLKAKANAEDRSYVLMVHKISDVEISGGEILGDRDRHLGTTGEWGHGIMVRGASRVTIRDMLIRKCWGDGISIAATVPVPGEVQIASVDVIISNIASIGNRRGGMSVGQSRGVKVYNSEFSYTSGTTPGCGINIESDLDHPGASAMHIENCMFQYNQGNGIQVYRRSVGTTIKNCLIEKNNGYGILTIGAKDVWIALNTIRSNQLIGVGVRSQCSNVNLAENRFYNNARRFRSYDLPMLTPAVARTGNVLPRHTEVVNSVNTSINTNLYHDK